MTLAPKGPNLVRFGEFALDLQSGELTRDGRRCLLPDQPLRILTVLLRQPGALVTRADLRRQLWPDDTFVDFEHGLNAAVKRLREALGDSAASGRFIETLPRRGYRFVGTLSVESDPLGGEPAGISPIHPAGAPAPARRAIRASAVSLIVAVLLGAAGLRWFRAVRQPTLVRLTSTSGVNADPALSPDGSLLAYASDRGGRGGLDIWVQPTGGGDPLPLTSDAPDEAEPSFSPNGAEIVFSRRDTGLFTLGALGGEPRLIVRAAWARSPRFSPDGRSIAYWTGFPASVLAGGVSDALATISLVPSAGGPPQELAPSVASARYPVWSPDGERILFLGEDDTDQKRFDWYLMRRNGTGLLKTEAVPAIRAAGVLAGPPIPGSWTAGRGVAFATNEADSSSVWEIPLSPETGRVLAAPRRLTFGTALERSPTVAASGRIAFSSVVEHIGVWRVPIDEGTGVATGPPERVVESAASDRLQSLSADGTALLFMSLRTNVDEAWVHELGSGLERQVTHGGADDSRLSPDGSRIAFSTLGSGQRSLELIDVRGGPASPLCTDCGMPDDWSRDGLRILLGRGLPRRLALYDVATGGQAELTSHPKWNLQHARFSPDAQWVAFFTTNSPNVRQVYAARVVPGQTVDTRAWVPVVTDHGCHPSWSADGSQLYHFSFRDGAFCPWVQRVDPATRRPIGPPRAVLHLHNPRLRASSGAAATNVVRAGYLYFTATETRSNIWLLDSGK